MGVLNPSVTSPGAAQQVPLVLSVVAVLLIDAVDRGSATMSAIQRMVLEIVQMMLEIVPLQMARVMKIWGWQRDHASSAK